MRQRKREAQFVKKDVSLVVYILVFGIKYTYKTKTIDQNYGSTFMCFFSILVILKIDSNSQTRSYKAYI